MKVLFSLLMLLVAVPAWAFTHTFKLDFSYTSGNATSFNVYMDGAKVKTFVEDGTRTGISLPVTFDSGTHTFTMTAVAPWGEESPKSPPFVIDLSLPAPSAIKLSL
jgi:hypothetical protein